MEGVTIEFERYLPIKREKRHVVASFGNIYRSKIFSFGKYKYKPIFMAIG